MVEISDDFSSDNFEEILSPGNSAMDTLVEFGHSSAQKRHKKENENGDIAPVPKSFFVDGKLWSGTEENKLLKAWI